MPRSRVRPFLFALLVVVGLAACAFVGCIPGYTFGEAGSGDGGLPDATSGMDASVDGTVDSAIDSANPSEASVDAAQDSDSQSPIDGSSAAVAIADAGSKVGSTGYGYQLHEVFAENDQRYWYFYVDDTAGEIKSVSSPDFVTWTPGAAIALGADYTLDDGNNFSVAYASLGGKDVVHFVLNAHSQTSGFETLHVRTTITSGALTASAPLVLPESTNGGTCPADAPATILTPGGRVYDVTAWTNHGSTESTTCDTNVYLAPGTDLGTSWDAGTFGYDGYYVSIPSYAYSHDLVSLPDAGLVMLLYPDEDNAGYTLFDSIGWALSSAFDGGEPGEGGGVDMPVADELFNGSGKTSSSNDWSACRLGASEVHVVRHAILTAPGTVSAFQEAVYDGSSWQTTTSPPAASTSLSNTGVVLLSGVDSSHGMLLVTLGFDGTLNIARWTSAGWTQAGHIPADANARQSLAGSGCGSVRPTIFWTETIGPANVIESADLSSFLP